MTTPHWCIFSEAPRSSNEAWRLDLVDQCVRRIMGGMKEWGANKPSLATHVFPEVNARLRTARLQCQVLAFGLELGSGALPLRGGVLPELSRGLIEPLLEAEAEAAEAAMNDLRRQMSRVDVAGKERDRALEEVRSLVGRPLVHRRTSIADKWS